MNIDAAATRLRFELEDMLDRVDYEEAMTYRNPAERVAEINRRRRTRMDTLFDEGALLRDQALGRVEANANDLWVAAAKDALLTVATARDLFTADDVVALLPDYGVETHEPRAMGAVFRWAQRERIAVPTDRYQPTTRPQGHKGPRRIWRSLV